MALSRNRFYYYGRFSKRSADNLTDNDIQLVGSVKTYTRSSETKQLSTVVTDAIPELLAYKMPDRDSVDVLLAVQERADCGIQVDNLLEEALGQSTSILLDAFPHVPRTKDKFSVEDFITVVLKLDPSKSSGFPSTLFAPKKGQVFEDTVLLLDLIEATMYRMMLLETVGEWCETPLDFHSLFLADFINISIKEEPVKVTKTSGRLITAPGLVSTFCSALLFSPSSQALKDNLYESYSGIGIGFDKYHSHVLRTKHNSLGFESDVPGFDTTVDVFEAIKAAELRGRASGFGSKRMKIAIQLERSYFHKLFNIKGDIYSHNRKSWQPSGRWDTSDSNTAIRSNRAVAASLVSLILAPEIVNDYPLTSVGDDCKEPKLAETEKAYEILGLPLRDVEVSTALNLCSHVWEPGKPAYSKRILKGLYHMLLDINYETASGFFSEYRSHPQFDQLYSKASEIRPEVKMYVDRFLFETGEIASRPVYEECKAKKKKVKKVKRKSRPVYGPMTKTEFDAANQPVIPPPKPLKPLKTVRHQDTHKAACALIDPFCNHARAAKLPDGLGSGTVTYQIHGFYSHATLVHGGSLFYYGGCLPYGYLGTTYASPNYTTQAAFNLVSGSSGTFTAYAARYRIVSWGLIIRNSAPALTAQGSLIVSRITSMPAFSTNIPQGLILGSESTVYPLNASTVVACIGKPAGSGAKVFEAQNTSTTEIAENWQVFKIEIVGAAADTNNKVTVEVVYNVEFTLDDSQQGLNQFITQSMPANPVALQVASKVQNATSSFFSQGVETATKFLADEASKALNAVAAEGWSLLGAL